MDRLIKYSMVNQTVHQLVFLPPLVYQCICCLDFSKLFEIRLRANKAIRVCYGGEFFYLSLYNNIKQKGEKSCSVTLDKNCSDRCLKLSAQQIMEIVLRAAEFSIYAVNDRISSGFITIKGGIRVGVAGEVVYEDGFVKTQKNFTSLVIRIPHEITGSADYAYSCLKKSKNKNILLISPPGCGKTTVLRDLTRQLSNSGSNVLLVDERGEIAACLNGVPSLNVGENTDIVTNAKKDYAFEFGIRTLRPDYIVTDELASTYDFMAVKRAALSGVNVVASLHACDEDDIKNKKELLEIFESKIFGLYVFLSLKNGAGTYEKVLNQDLKQIS